mgnify:CR=1 FL=1
MSLLQYTSKEMFSSTELVRKNKSIFDKLNKKEIEKAILVEIEKAVDLVGQENIKHVKIIENKVVLVCELDTNLDALMVRYGVMAFVKKTLNEIIIAVDIDFILKSKLNAK